jgi:hypothetical protein
MLPTAACAALHPRDLGHEDLADQKDGTGVEVVVDDSDSVRRIEIHFAGQLKPLNDKGDVFLSSADHRLIGFVARPATKDRDICLVSEHSGMVTTFSDVGVLLADRLKAKYGPLDPHAFILTDIVGETATIIESCITD